MVFQLTQDQLKENLFLALKGKKMMNKFISTALKKDAGCVVTSSKIKLKNKRIIKVKDEITFLNNFAKIKARIFFS